MGSEEEKKVKKRAKAGWSERISLSYMWWESSSKSERVTRYSLVRTEEAFWIRGAKSSRTKKRFPLDCYSSFSWQGCDSLKFYLAFKLLFGFVSVDFHNSLSILSLRCSVTLWLITSQCSLNSHVHCFFSFWQAFPPALLFLFNLLHVDLMLYCGSIPAIKSSCWKSLSRDMFIYWKISIIAHVHVKSSTWSQFYFASQEL